LGPRRTVAEQEHRFLASRREELVDERRVLLMSSARGL
jgi:hypothetical protein